MTVLIVSSRAVLVSLTAALLARPPTVTVTVRVMVSVRVCLMVRHVMFSNDSYSSLHCDGTLAVSLTMYCLMISTLLRLLLLLLLAVLLYTKTLSVCVIIAMS